MKLTGTIKREDLEGGFMVLIADDGTRYNLGGATKALRQEGLKVELEGEIDPSGVSIANDGQPVFRVKSSKKLS